MIYACGFLRYWPDSDFLIQTRNPAAMANVVQGGHSDAGTLPRRFIRYGR